MSQLGVEKDGTIAAIVLAAGYSERMGRFKPLLPLGACRTIERVTDMFRTAGIQDILVVTGHRGDEIRQVMAPWKVRCVENPEYPDGMFTSVLAGIRALPAECRAFFIHPVDIPLVRSQTVRRLMAGLQHSSTKILYPAFKGRRGHPTLIRACLRPEILEWSGVDGLRALLKRHDDDCMDIAMADEAVLLDLDTPSDYSRMLARLVNEGLPSEDECRVLMDEIQALPPAVAGHCRAVAVVARRLAEALNAAGGDINIELAHAAALLHDIARTEKEHAHAGARLLAEHGFTRLAPLVSSHMDLEVRTGQLIDEAQIVFLADKLIAGDQRVDLEQRFASKMKKYGQTPAVMAGIRTRRENARRILAVVEETTGLSIETIAGPVGPLETGA